MWCQSHHSIFFSSFGLPWPCWPAPLFFSPLSASSLALLLSSPLLLYLAMPTCCWVLWDGSRCQHRDEIFWNKDQEAKSKWRIKWNCLFITCLLLTIVLTLPSTQQHKAFINDQYFNLFTAITESLSLKKLLILINNYNEHRKGIKKIII